MGDESAIFRGGIFRVLGSVFISPAVVRYSFTLCHGALLLGVVRLLEVRFAWIKLASVVSVFVFTRSAPGTALLIDKELDG